MKIPKKVKIALDHVRQFHPEVTMVIFTSNGLWCYLDSDFNGPTFGPKIDVNILQDAADVVEQFPAIFEINA